jgi:alkylation response protein AidB-like acyl-CoA dehydrogenase
MELEFTPEQEEFREELRTWYEENLPDGWLEGERDIPDDPDEREAFLREWQRKLAEGGWAGVHWPEEYGGRGATVVEQLIFNEESARIDPPPAINTIGIDYVGPTLIAAGTEEQKERFVPNILDGEEVWCQGYSEPETGSDLASLQTKAIDEGDHYRIDGQKIWTSNAHYADWCFLLARTDDSGPKHHGITAFLVDMDQDAISYERIEQIREGSTFNQVYFDDAVAEKDMIVGDVDDGWRVAMQLSAFERSALTQAFTLEQNFDELLEYCKSETRGGQPLSEDPVVRQELAEMDARIQSGKLTYYRNVSKQMETGEPGPEGSMGKVYTGEIRRDLERLRTRLMGPEGALWGDDSHGGEWQSDYLGTFGALIAGGTSDIQRNIIAERVLGLPKDLPADAAAGGGD